MRAKKSNKSIITYKQDKGKRSALGTMKIVLTRPFQLTNFNPANLKRNFHIFLLFLTGGCCSGSPRFGRDLLI